MPSLDPARIAGRERRFTSVAGGPSRSPAAGARIRVRYLPAEPKLAYVDSFLHLRAAPAALALLGWAGLFAALQFVRKVSGFAKPSQANEAVFLAAIDQIAQVSHTLIDALQTSAAPKNREDEAAKARDRAATRYARI